MLKKFKNFRSIILLIITIISLFFLMVGCSVPDLSFDKSESRTNEIIQATSVFRSPVTRTGSNLVVDGNSFYYNGTNQYYLFYKSHNMIDEVIEDAKALGLSVMRTWAFCDGPYYDVELQTSPRNYNETSFRNLDYVIYKAGIEGVRLVLPLVNNWDDFGGMQQYVNWSSSANSHDDFYTDTYCRDLYKDYVSYVLNRVNTYTGVRYKDDPAIMIWELANEPRATSDSSGNKLQNWIDEMAAHIKSIDSTHLVSTGIEGFYSGGSDWKYDGSQGTDFIRNHSGPDIDIATFHLYPDHWEMSESESLQWIEEHVNDAHNIIGKPIYLGEFGIMINRGSESFANRDRIYTDWYNKLDQLDADGAHFWLLSGHQDDGSLYPDYDSFTVYYPEDSSTNDVIYNYSLIVMEKSGQEPPPTPTPTPPPAPDNLIDFFEGYNGSDSNLQSTYTLNTGGNSATLTLSTSYKNEGNYGMKYYYKIAGSNYAGVIRNLGSKNWSGDFNGIQFWLKPDNSNRLLTIQFKESGGEYWEANYTISGSTARIVELPWTSFAHPGWFSGGNGVKDLGSISEISIYVNKGSGSTGTGSIYFDSIELIGNSAPTPPDPNLKQGSTNIASGTGSYDFGTIDVGSSSNPVTFTIENLGDEDLTISSVSLINGDTGDFDIDLSSLSTTIAGGASTTFDVTFTPLNSGNRSAVVSINNNSIEDPYNFSVLGSGQIIITEPEINLKQGVTNINSGSGSYNFGNLNVGSSSSEITFTIENTGNADLNVSSISLTSGDTGDFVLNTSSVSSPVPAGNNTTFKVSFAPASVGNRSAIISINNNDPNENPYTFTVLGNGTVVTADSEINLKQGSTDILAVTGRYDFGIIEVGLSSANVTFTIENIGDADLVISSAILDGGSVADFTLDDSSMSSPVLAGGTTSFTVRFNPLSTGSKIAIVSITNNDPDESTYTFTILGSGAAAAVPEINVKQGSSNIASVTGSYNFSSIDVGSTSAYITFTVENIGDADLDISNVTIAGTDSSQFTLNSSALSTPVSAGGSTTFSVRFNPTTSGNKTAIVAITNNDPDESTYTFTILGYGATVITGQTPYGGTPRSIPGRIDVEDYDEGGEGEAYHDTTSGNSFGLYRNDDVDIEYANDSDGGYSIGNVSSGEWMEYTVDVANSGTYNIELRIATKRNGKYMHIEFDGVNKTGRINIPRTGGWSSWQTITVSDVSLNSGQQIMRLAMDTDLININYVNIIESGSAGTITVDPLNDLNIVSSHSSNLTFDTSNTQYFEEDPSRLNRTTSTYEYIVYNYNNISKLVATTFFWPYETLVDFRFYVSNDGSNWTVATPAKNNTGGEWEKVIYTLDNLDAEYVKIEFRNTSGNSWTPQIGEVEITHE